MNVQIIIRIERGIQNNTEYHVMNATTDTIIDYIVNELSCIIRQYCTLGIYYAYSNEPVYFDGRYTLLHYGINKNKPTELLAFVFPKITNYVFINYNGSITLVGKWKTTSIKSRPFNPERRIEHERRLLFLRQSLFGSAFPECAILIERFLMNKEDDFYYLY
jgi:hypothetical protein